MPKKKTMHHHHTHDDHKPEGGKHWRDGTKEVAGLSKTALSDLLHEIGICNWRQVTNIANEIRENIE